MTSDSFDLSHDQKPIKVVGVFANLSLDSDDGVNQQTRQHIAAMASRGVEWSVIFFAPRAISNHLQLFSKNVVIINISRAFVSLAIKTVRDVAIYLALGMRAGLLRRVHDELMRSNADMLFLDGLPLAPLRYAFPDGPAILSCVDAMSLRHYRFLSQAKTPSAWLKHAIRGCCCEILERLFLGQFSHIHVVSEVDAAYLRRLCPKANIVAIPVRAPVVEPSTPSNLQGKSLVVWGDIAVPYLRDGLIRFLARVQPVLGSAPPKIIVLGRRVLDNSLKRILKDCPNTEYLAWTHDVDELLAGARAVLLLDENGTGIKNRAIHAMSLGKIVIGTSCALEGIPVQNRKHAFICDRPNEFAEAIADVSRMTELQVSDMKIEIIKFVRAHYSDEIVSQRWQSIFIRDVREF